jgi:hypothetical protein
MELIYAYKNEVKQCYSEVLSEIYIVAFAA